MVNLSGYVDHSNKTKTYQSHYIGCKNIVNIFLNFRPISFIQIGSSLEYGKLNSPQREKMTNANPFPFMQILNFFQQSTFINLQKKLSSNNFKALPSVWS